MKEINESELRKIISKYDAYSLSYIKSALIELKNRGGSVGSGFLETVSEQFDLNSVDELFEINKSDEQNLEKSEIIELSAEELYRKISILVNNYKSGFGLLLFSNFTLILAGIISYFGTQDNYDLKSVKNIVQISFILSIVGYLIFLIGVFILYNASKFKKLRH